MEPDHIYKPFGPRGNNFPCDLIQTIIYMIFVYSTMYSNKEFQPQGNSKKARDWNVKISTKLRPKKAIFGEENREEWNESMNINSVEQG